MIDIYDLIPKNVKRAFGSEFSTLLVNSHDVFSRFVERPVTILSCNIRFVESISGIMRAAEETDAIVGFQLGQKESKTCGIDIEKFVKTIVYYAQKLKFSKPFFIIGDNYRFHSNTPQIIEKAKSDIKNMYKSGFTGFAFDASPLPVEENIAVSSELTRYVKEWELGVELEIGEIEGKKGDLTEILEAESFLINLIKDNARPNLLAISNGSHYGNKKSRNDGHINLDRTLEIYKAIHDKKVCIVQHGVTDVPLPILSQFPYHGIRKANISTLWQNIVHQNLPGTLFQKMEDYAEDNNRSLFEITSVFREEIGDIPEQFKKKIEQITYVYATEIIEAFKATETASLLKSILN